MSESGKRQPRASIQIESLSLRVPGGFPGASPAGARALARGVGEALAQRVALGLDSKIGRLRVRVSADDLRRAPELAIADAIAAQLDGKVSP